MPSGNRPSRSKLWPAALVFVELASCDGSRPSSGSGEGAVAVDPSVSATGIGAGGSPASSPVPSTGGHANDHESNEGGRASDDHEPAANGGVPTVITSPGGSPAATGGATGAPSAGAGNAASGASSGGSSPARGGGTSFGDAGTGNSGSSAGGVSNAGSGGTPLAGASGGGSDGGPVIVDVDLADAIPEPYRQPALDPGLIVKRSYPCYHYTDETAGLETEPSNLVLAPREEPITKELNVYLPPGYSGDVQYPVVYVLHGLTDFEDTWLERGEPHPAVLIDNLIALGDIRPILAVFPNGNSSSTFTNRTFENQAGYYYFANELVNDIIPFVEAEYSVESAREARAICGFSMGGMQTINAGLCQSLEHFAWFGAFAAAPTTYTADRIAQYLTDQNETGSHPVHFFYNICGASDMTSESHVPAVDGLAEASEYVTDGNLAYHEVPGAHDYVVSSVGLYNFLRIAFAN